MILVEFKFHTRRDLCLFSLLMYPKQLEQWLAQSKYSIFICWINDSLNFSHALHPIHQQIWLINYTSNPNHTSTCSWLFISWPLFGWSLTWMSEVAFLFVLVPPLLLLANLFSLQHQKISLLCLKSFRGFPLGFKEIWTPFFGLQSLERLFLSFWPHFITISNFLINFQSLVFYEVLEISNFHPPQAFSITVLFA